ncbi:MAG: hypothetical protein ACM337_06520 [Syntrophaceae bacterium]
MYRTIKNVALAASTVILFFFVLFVVNQTAQVVGLADRVSPAFGTAVLWFLLGRYNALAAHLFIIHHKDPYRAIVYGIIHGCVNPYGASGWFQFLCRPRNGGVK